MMNEHILIRFLRFLQGPSTGARTGRFFEGTSRFVLGCVLMGAAAGSSAFAQISYKVSPASLSVSFGATSVGRASNSKIISITNTGTSSFTVSNFSISPSQFQLFYGYAPIVLGPGQAANFSVMFVPNSAITYSGQFSMTISGVTDPIIVNLAGTGQTTGAITQVSASSLSFGNLPVGTVSAPQTVTVKNVGTSKVTVTSIVADPPFTVTGAKLIGLDPGKSTSFQVTFNSTGVGTSNNVLVIQYNVVGPNGIDLTGTGTATASLAVSSYPILASATQAAAYSAKLSAAGGVGALSWTPASGSVLPLGLSLSSDGIIAGTLDSSVAAGSYNFSVRVTDSNTPPSTASLQVTLPVGTPTGASCNNISWPLNNSGSPLVPLTDLGPQLYLGSQGGLYPGGSNVRPASHDADGVAIAQGIQPLDANGNYDPNGKYALMSVGLSVTFDDFAQFMVDANADPMKNPHLVLVPGAQPKAGAKDMSNATSPFWTTILNYYLPQSGVTANQVVAAWLMDVVANPTGSFPSDMASLQSDLEKMTQNLHTFFPNLKLLYFTSRYYGGYSYGIRNPADVEPYAYQSGFAVKWAIEDQLNGLPALNYNPAQGPVLAPWMAWGQYDWANGLLPRSDGLVWTCQDQQADGTHPSNPAGRQKDSDLMMNFFKSDSTTTPWFLAPGVR